MRAVRTRLVAAEADTCAHASGDGGRAAPVPDPSEPFSRLGNQLLI